LGLKNMRALFFSLSSVFFVCLFCREGPARAVWGRGQTDDEKVEFFHARRPQLQRRLFSDPPDFSPAKMAAVDLSEIDTHALVAEMERRLECATKPEKRVILIGARRGGAERETEREGALRNAVVAVVSADRRHARAAAACLVQGTLTRTPTVWLHGSGFGAHDRRAKKDTRPRPV